MDIIPASLVGFLQWISFLTFLAKIQLLDAWIYQQYEELDLWMSFNVSGVRNRNNYKTTNLRSENELWCFFIEGKDAKKLHKKISIFSNKLLKVNTNLCGSMLNKDN